MPLVQKDAADKIPVSKVSRVQITCGGRVQVDRLHNNSEKMASQFLCFWRIVGCLKSYITSHGESPTIHGRLLGSRSFKTSSLDTNSKKKGSKLNKLLMIRF